VEWDRNREQQKRKELLATLESALLGSAAKPRDTAEEVLNAFVRITPPQKEEVVMKYMTMFDDGRGGGRSVKPGNIRLNMGALIEAVAGGALSAVGVVHFPFTASFAAIILWNSVWRAVKVDITENDAAVLYVMWTDRDENDEVTNENLLQRCNTHLEFVQRQPLSARDIAHSLDTLGKIQTIKRSRFRPENWWLREWIRVTYR
jgi:hypothetical protein